MNDPERHQPRDNGLEDDEQAQAVFLATLFGEQTWHLAMQLDIADLCITDAMRQAIGAGVNQLKRLRGDLPGQQAYLASLEDGSRLLLCLWVADMNLLEKLR